MAEAVGISLGIFSAFHLVVEDIRLVRAGRTFAADYEIADTKLLLTECRLTRWGESVGITTETTTTSTFAKLQPEEHRKIAKQTLEQIRSRLEATKAKKGKFDLPQGGTEETPRGGQEAVDLPPIAMGQEDSRNRQ